MKKLGMFLMLAVMVSFFCCTEKSKESAPKESTVPSAPVSSISYNFEEGMDSWKEFGKVKISQSKDKQKDGKASMKISGTAQSGLWGFAGSKQMNVFPGKRYRFSGWMRIDSISANTSFFKCELWNEGKWVKNIDSTVYDLKKKGEWQELTTVFDAPEGKNVTLSIAVEKRPMEKDVQAILYIDNIKIEKAD